MTATLLVQSRAGEAVQVERHKQWARVPLNLVEARCLESMQTRWLLWNSVSEPDVVVRAPSWSLSHGEQRRIGPD